ncbi:TetR/AcrR family transcriptional regulator [Brevibacillus borstelensis]|jgi:AcrR family transcriptional regulator|uniref:TetR/AcrR family transcriptional regulator n=1 Tax=Brevibacillus borstelensis TaxID=45462 RepID=UPI0004F3CBAE|nr:TetR/AcrR family transcriptional regulator [Brevibacillus borstelensis]KKX54830.1 transcriptional regulator [Brevibacillus borstelensis cifa_chp40]MCC0563086.1 TetR/AcrR family transcriptional regulator [Brevibacillus borstelensis]MCM3558487.1 TetR/AcrR family transcriptional regulator [Brevibacillus borstelensis]MCM3591397.1 TetR/AcrR family transcriptional regulator [Brevibacillus borstelensis]MCM3621439.1 TetR/AcrR family transcriptional regulator [Brevibacillus borstelensis]
MDKPDHEKIQSGKGDEQETRERILAAARQLMSQKGYKGATTRKISELAGVNEVTIFRHFKNKERILIELLEEMTEIRPALEKAIHACGHDVKAMLIHYGEAYYNALVERKEVLIICLIESQNHPEVFNLLSRMPQIADEMLSEKLQEMHEAGLLPKGDFATAAHMFVSAFFHSFLARHWVKVDCDSLIDIPTMTESSADILLRGIGSR